MAARSAGHADPTPPLRDLLLQENADLFLFAIQPRLSQHTFRAAKQSALGAGGCQSFACALGARPRAVTFEYNWSPELPDTILIGQIERTRNMLAHA